MNAHRLFLTAMAALLMVTSELSGDEWRQTNGARFMTVTPVGRGQPGFTVLSPESTGVRFTNFLAGERGLTNQIYYSGSGVAAGDIDGDGRIDLYFCSLDGRNALYRNLGHWKFAEVTQQAGVPCGDQASTGAVFADVDGDGDLDLLVSSIGHGVRLFLNDGRGRFTEKTAEAGLTSDHASMTMAFGDVDGDGDLDLYVANYRKETFQDTVNVRFLLRSTNGVTEILSVNDRPTTAPDLTNRYFVNAAGTVSENAEADVLYLNDGHGRFLPVSWTGGMFLDEEGRPLQAAPLDWGLSAMFRDMNGDGAPDLYVCNDNESPDRIWINDGLGHFRALSKRALRETSFASMGIDFSDINRDGFDDFFVADMLGYTRATLHTQMPTRHQPFRLGEGDARVAVPRNTLFLNRGDNSYAEIAQLAGVEASDWSWCPVFLDVDLDGFEDLLITTGLGRNLREADARFAIETRRRQGRLTQQEFLVMRQNIGPLRTPNFAFRNRGNLTFEDASARWGFDSTEISHGMCLADLDNDGDLDAIVSCLNAPPLLCRNDTPAPRLGVRLKSSSANARGIGARIEVTGGPVPQSQEMVCGGRYLSCDDPMRVFAAGAGTNLTISVRWRDGATTTITGASPNHIYEISDSDRVSRRAGTGTVARAAMFSDVSRLLAHRHSETEFDDFARQRMLTKRLGTAGPGVTWCDLDRDGRDDLIVGSGRGGEVAVFQNLSDRFRQAAISSIKVRADDDVPGIAAWPVGQGTNLLLLAHSNYETPQTNALALHQVAGASGKLIAQAAAWNSTVGSVAVADVDGDGKLEVFAAGRVIAGQFPRPASSRVYHVNDRALEMDEAASAAFATLGLINGAVFTDLDSDGRPELVVTCEWDSLRVFRFQNGKFVEITAALRLDGFKGWWQGIAAGDFDGDGRMDIVAANWGRNHRYSRFAVKPIQIFFGDVSGDGTVEMFEAYHAPEMNKLVPARHWDTVAFQMPFLQQRIRSFANFSQLGISEILAETPVNFETRAATTFDSAVFLNRGDHFEPAPLPIEAQLTPAFGVCVADFDGDGREDVFLAQNFFGTDNETSRYDAGRGLLLLGDGAGHFRSVSAQESGIEISGEGRGAAVCDYDGDGRMDLCVGQNSVETKLYHNERARPGLRVRLVGPGENVPAVGAQVRAIYKDGSAGPAREIHLGSGWLSQDSAVPIIASPQPLKSISVRWPGGKTTHANLPSDAREVSVDFSGTLSVTK